MEGIRKQVVGTHSELKSKLYDGWICSISMASCPCEMVTRIGNLGPLWIMGGYGVAETDDISSSCNFETPTIDTLLMAFIHNSCQNKKGLHQRSKT